MKPSTYNSFFNVASGLLTLTAVAKVWTLAGHAKILEAQDPLLHLGYRPLLISVTLVEVSVAIYLLRGRNDLQRCLALLWLTSNFLSYHLGNYLLNIRLCPCLGELGDNLPLPKGFGSILLQVVALYWLITCLNMLSREWWAPQWQRGVSTVRKMLFRGSATDANRV
jgi:hypothetical protein